MDLSVTAPLPRPHRHKASIPVLCLGVTSGSVSPQWTPAPRSLTPLTNPCSGGERPGERWRQLVWHFVLSLYSSVLSFFLSECQSFFSFLLYAMSFFFCLFFNHSDCITVIINTNTSHYCFVELLRLLKPAHVTLILWTFFTRKGRLKDGWMNSIICGNFCCGYHEVCC